MKKYNWSLLNPLQVGQYAEYFVKMTFTMFGFDVFTSEVDDKGIDFVIKNSKNDFFEIQVKSLRIEKTGYVFQTKDKFDIENTNLFLALVLFADNQDPSLFLINSQEWRNPNDLLKDREYIGLKSKPEWGINISKKNSQLLEKYVFENVIENIK
jgi:hypothetical protein